MFQCYYNETIIFNDRNYIGKRINTECFETETEAEQYCIRNVGIQEYPDGSYTECEMRYEEVANEEK